MILDGTITFSDSTVQSSSSNTYSFGLGQTWTDLTASRALSTTYTNSTGRPIAVSVYWQATGLGTATATVSGLQIAATAIAASAASNSGGLSFVVPVGATYSVACNVSFTRWAELR